MKRILFLLFFITFFSLASTCYGADIFFGTNSKTVNVGSDFEIGVFLDAKPDIINALEGSITFPSDSLSFEEVHNGGSTVTFWVKPPTLTEKGSVSFSGIIPGGFTGSKGYLFSLIFKATQKGKVAISSNNEKVYLNDGQGTPVAVRKAPLAIEIVGKGSDQKFYPLYDPTAPEPFELQISRNQNLFDGKYFLTFTAQDKGSGIDHYEIMESGQFGSFKSLFAKSQWVSAQSPYLLQDQSLASIVQVKAVDRAGNERIAKVNVQHFLWYENYIIWSIIVIVGLIFIGYALWKKMRV